MSTERLQKILARGGFASRRAAEELISEGRVRVNGRVVTELGSKADPYRDKVEVNGVRVVAERAVYVVLHKPRGVVTTMSDPEGRPSVKEILAPIGSRVYPVGRLDFATSGVLLATNDGDFAEGMMHPKKAVPKTYVVKVAGAMQPKDMDRWREGIRLEDGVTLPAKLKLLRHEGDKTWFELTIREGRNQQIRRMGEASGFPVMRLARLSFAGVTAEGLRPGEWRFLAPDELVDLKKDYGVPRRIVDAEMRPTGRTRHTRASAVTTTGKAPGTRGRARTVTEREQPSDEIRAEGWGRGRSERVVKNEHARARGQGPALGGREPRGGDPRAGRDHGSPATAGRGSRAGGGGDTRGRSRPPAKAERGSPRVAGGAARGEPELPKRARPRNGGGSSARQDYDVSKDSGGGARRGESHDARREAVRGRGARRGAAAEERARSDRPRVEAGVRGGDSRATGSGGGSGNAGHAAARGDRKNGRTGRPR